MQAWRILFSFVLAAVVRPLAAQPALRFLGGVALSSGIPYTSATRYTPVLSPRLEAGLYIPLCGSVALVSGLVLQQKGFRSRSRLADDRPGDYTEVHSMLRCTQLQIPLQLSGGIVRRRSWSLEAAGGMSYGFILNAYRWSEWRFYRNNQFIHADRSESKVPTALMPFDNRISSPAARRYGALSLFNPALAASLTLRIRQHFLLQAFAECNLYGISTVSATPLRLYSCGLSAGYRL